MKTKLKEIMAETKAVYLFLLFAVGIRDFSYKKTDKEEDK